VEKAKLNSQWRAGPRSEGDKENEMLKQSKEKSESGENLPHSDEPIPYTTKSGNINLTLSEEDQKEKTEKPKLNKSGIFHSKHSFSRGLRFSHLKFHDIYSSHRPYQTRKYSTECSSCLRRRC
jgi:hypothetical protein